MCRKHVPCAHSTLCYDPKAGRKDAIGHMKFSVKQFNTVDVTSDRTKKKKKCSDGARVRRISPPQRPPRGFHGNVVMPNCGILGVIFINSASLTGGCWRVLFLEPLSSPTELGHLRLHLGSGIRGISPLSRFLFSNEN